MSSTHDKWKWRGVDGPASSDACRDRGVLWHHLEICGVCSKNSSFGSSEPAGFLPCLCSVQLSCLVASTCFARISAPGYSLEPSVEVLEGWAGPDSSSLLSPSVRLLQIPKQELSCEVVWKRRGCLHAGHRRGEGGVHFRSFCWPFASQVLSFGEKQDLEGDLEFCEVRVKAGFNVLAIASVAEEIHNNIYDWWEFQG